MGYLDSSEKARLKRRQKKIERNKRKRKKKLASRKKAHGTVIGRSNPTETPRRQKKKRAERGKKFLSYYKEQTPSIAGDAVGRLATSVELPEVFSFINNPESTLRSLSKVVRICALRKGKWIFIDHSKCRVIDYGAQSVLSVIMQSAVHWLGIRVKGKFPESDVLRKIVYTTGFPAEAGVEAGPEFVHLPLQYGRKNKEAANKATARERLTDRFVKHIDECLLVHGKSLTYKGRRYLGELVSEVINNAEDHSMRDDWWIGGYMHLPENHSRGNCYFTVFNLGRSVSDSIDDLSEFSKLRKDIEALIAKHSRWSPFRALYGPDQLKTLYAMQEGVTRFNEDSDQLESDRGQGTVDMIKHFQKLGQTVESEVSPEMCLVSGNTYLLFDDRYDMRIEANSSSRNVIAFNRENDLQRPPDGRNVKSLKRYFPGTVISGRFYLDPEYLESHNSHGDYS